jgi:hypothetical protein
MTENRQVENDPASAIVLLRTIAVKAAREVTVAIRRLHSLTPEGAELCAVHTAPNGFWQTKPVISTPPCDIQPCTPP